MDQKMSPEELRSIAGKYRSMAEFKMRSRKAHSFGIKQYGATVFNGIFPLIKKPINSSSRSHGRYRDGL